MRRRQLVVAALCLLVGLCLIFGIWGLRKATPERQIVDAMYRSASRPRKTKLDVDGIAAFGPRAVPVLCMTIAEEWQQNPDGPENMIPSWVQALGLIGDSRATPTLIAVADHHDSSVRNRAAFAMADIHDERCLPALKRLSQDNVESVARVARAPSPAACTPADAGRLRHA